MTPVYGVVAIAEVLGCHEDTVWRIVQQYKTTGDPLPVRCASGKKRGHKYAFHEELLAWMQRRPVVGQEMANSTLPTERPRTGKIIAVSKK